MKRRLLAPFFALAVTLAAGFGLEGVRLGAPLLVALASLFLLFLPYFLYGLTELRGPRSPAWAALLLVAYLLYGLGTGAFEWASLARLAVYIAVPTILVLLAQGRSGPGALDLLAVLAIWLPFDLRLLEGIWTWPEGQGSYGFQTVLAVDLALFLFVVVRGIEGIGYRFALTFGQALAAIGSFALFSAIAIPLGQAIEFIRYEPRPFDPLGFAASFLAILLFIGIPEELLFRGLIQNFLDHWWGKGMRSLAAASLVFGSAHLDNDEAPNLEYALMATLAGLFYGWTFRRSGNLLAPALVHALVDAVWRAFFRSP